MSKPLPPSVAAIYALYRMIKSEAQALQAQGSAWWNLSQLQDSQLLALSEFMAEYGTKLKAVAEGLEGRNIAAGQEWSYDLEDLYQLAWCHAKELYRERNLSQDGMRDSVANEVKLRNSLRKLSEHEVKMTECIESQRLPFLAEYPLPTNISAIPRMVHCLRPPAHTPMLLIEGAETFRDVRCISRNGTVEHWIPESVHVVEHLLPGHCPLVQVMRLDTDLLNVLRRLIPFTGVHEHHRNTARVVIVLPAESYAEGSFRTAVILYDDLVAAAAAVKMSKRKSLEMTYPNMKNIDHGLVISVLAKFGYERPEHSDAAIDAASTTATKDLVDFGVQVRKTASALLHREKQGTAEHRAMHEKLVSMTNRGAEQLTQAKTKRAVLIPSSGREDADD